MPLSSGPSLFLASAPTSWQARHFLNTSAPSSALPSCATAVPKAPTVSQPAIIVFRQTCVRLRISSTCSAGDPSQAYQTGPAFPRDASQQRPGPMAVPTDPRYTLVACEG